MPEDWQENVKGNDATKPEDRVFRPMGSPVLHHVSLFVSDMGASTRFYSEGLGLVLSEEFDGMIGVRGTQVSLHRSQCVP